jgi:hypothetical protein
MSWKSRDAHVGLVFLPAVKKATTTSLWHFSAFLSRKAFGRKQKCHFVEVALSFRVAERRSAKAGHLRVVVPLQFQDIALDHGQHGVGDIGEPAADMAYRLAASQLDVSHILDFQRDGD